MDKPWSESSATILEGFKTSRETGLIQDQVSQRASEYGPNILKSTPPPGKIEIFLRQIKNPMAITLGIAAAISLFVGEGLDSVAILLILILNAVIGYFQENKSINAIEALKKLSAPKVRVKRDGKIQTINSESIVPGDIIQFEAGDLISADARVIEAYQLSADEAMLTGESVPVDKNEELLPVDTILPDRSNMLHSGSAINSGSGYAVVTQTGMKTEMGSIADMLDEQSEIKTPLQIKLEKVTKKLIVLGLIVIVAVVIIRYQEGVPALDILMAAISLAVAAIPEGMPTVVSLALMLAVHRMTKRKAIVRNLSSVEALGSVDVICTDKTGTLTTGIMSASEHYVLDKNMDEDFFKAIILCNNASDTGDTTEVALLKYAEQKNISVSEIRKKYPRLHEFSFDSQRKRMSVVVSAEAGETVYIKGAPESLLSEASNSADEISRLTEQTKNFSSQGFRILAVGQKHGPAKTQAEAESKVQVLGLIMIWDPPRSEAITAIKVCQDAGVRVVMITGDHGETAKAIARKLGIVKTENERVLTGKELEAMTDDEYSEKVEDIAVYARVSPSDKLRIIRALQKKNHFVAMTGDGVNDAPALKSAEIGIAMGKGGTEVARQASDIVLADDNFSTIVSAVEEGRAVYGNIRQTIQYLLSTNLAEILIVLGASVANLPVPFNPISLLWINLITDGLPSLALAAEPLPKNILSESNRPNPGTFFDKRFTVELVVMGLIITIIGLGAYLYLSRNTDSLSARSITFSLLVFLCLSRALSCRSETKTFFELPVNYFLILSLTFTFILHSFFQTTELFSRVFEVRPLSYPELGLLFFISLFPSTIIEIYKLIRRKKS